MKRYIRSATESNDKLARTSNDPTVLAQLATDEDKFVRWAVAENSNTPIEVLEQLANDEDEFVRSAVALNSNTPVDVLAQLANDEYYMVRYYVAANRNTPVDILAQLANDEDYMVRYYVAYNQSTPADVLAQLANDEERDVRQTAVKNRNCPASLKKSQKSKKSKKWPYADEWYNIESDDEFENMWSTYLSKPEDDVNKELQIFTEPSTQGGMGGMFIFDKSGSENESIYVDYQDWCDAEIEMAVESKSAKAYAAKYKAFIKKLISENWR